MEQNHTIYIVLTMSGTKFSRFLKFMSKDKSEFIHVSLTFDEDLKTLYSFGRKKLNMPWIAGYIEENPHKGVFKKYNPMCEVLSLNISEDKLEKLQEVLSFVQAHSKEYKYNYLGLVCVYFKIPHRLHRHFTCTEFIAWLLDSVDITPDVDKDVSLIVPNDYYKIPNIQSVYKGRMHSYCLE